MSTTTQQRPTGAPTRNLQDMQAGLPRATVQRPLAQRLPAPVAPEATMPQIGVGFDTLQSFEFTQRVARGLSLSTLVPEAYRAMVPRRGNRDQLFENPAALSNCIIALNMARRLGADPLMVMQNLYIVEGRPSWSAQFVISAINTCGRFQALKFRLVKGEQRTIEYTVWEYERGDRVPKQKKATIQDMTCVAYTAEKQTGEIVEGPPVTMEMAVLEGWFGKNGSKWQTMPEVMLRYRAAAFFGRLYAPEVLMGLPTQEEAREVIDAEMDESGTWQAPTPDSAQEASSSQESEAGPESADARTQAGDEPPYGTVKMLLEDKQPWTVVHMAWNGGAWWCWRTAGGEIDGRRTEDDAKEAVAAAYEAWQELQAGGGPELPLKGGRQASGGK